MLGSRTHADSIGHYGLVEISEVERVWEVKFGNNKRITTTVMVGHPVSS